MLSCSGAGNEDDLLNQLYQVLAGVRTGVYTLETVFQVTQSRQPVLIIRTNTLEVDLVWGRYHVYSAEVSTPVRA